MSVSLCDADEKPKRWEVYGINNSRSPVSDCDLEECGCGPWKKGANCFYSTTGRTAETVPFAYMHDGWQLRNGWLVRAVPVVPADEKPKRWEYYLGQVGAKSWTDDIQPDRRLHGPWDIKMIGIEPCSYVNNETGQEVWTHDWQLVNGWLVREVKE